MPDQQISLPEEVYAALLTEAQAQGVNPVEWIASKLSGPKETEQSPQNLAEALKGRVGRLSFEVPPDIHQKTGEGFTDILAEEHQ